MLEDFSSVCSEDNDQYAPSPNLFGLPTKNAARGLESQHRVLQSIQKQDSLFIDNQTYNVFFRILNLMQKYRIEYANSLISNQVPATNQVIIVKDFNPYFAMGFLRPNIRVQYFITKRYHFDKPFSDLFNHLDDDHYANCLIAFTLKAQLIKKLVRMNRTIYPRDLIITAQQKALSGISVYTDKMVTLKQFLDTHGKAPILIIDCGIIEKGITMNPPQVSNITSFCFTMNNPKTDSIFKQVNIIKKLKISAEGTSPVEEIQPVQPKKKEKSKKKSKVRHSMIFKKELEDDDGMSIFEDYHE